MIYCYTKANQMKGHRFTDDVAVVKAICKHSAIKKFRRLYADVQRDDVNRISIKFKYAKSLTDY